jgi:hypothetical protein
MLMKMRCSFPGCKKLGRWKQPGERALCVDHALAGSQPVNPWSWMSSAQYLAQVGHFLGAYSLLVTLRFFGVPFRALGLTTAVFIALAAWKEFVFDLAPPPKGEGDSFADSAMDFGFYCLGLLVAWAVILGAFYIHLR